MWVSRRNSRRRAGKGKAEGQKLAGCLVNWKKDDEALRIAVYKLPGQRRIERRGEQGASRGDSKSSSEEEGLASLLSRNASGSMRKEKKVRTFCARSARLAAAPAAAAAHDNTLRVRLTNQRICLRNATFSDAASPAAATESTNDARCLRAVLLTPS